MPKKLLTRCIVVFVAVFLAFYFDIYANVNLKLRVMCSIVTSFVVSGFLYVIFAVWINKSKKKSEKELGE